MNTTQVRFFVQVAWKKEIARVWDQDLEKLPALIRRKCFSPEQLASLAHFNIQPVLTINPSSTFAKFIA